MIVEPRFLLICLFIALTLQSDDSLLKMGQKQTCIKQVIAVFAEEKNCASLDDSIKTHLALKMTDCLLAQMDKSLPSECFGNKKCKLEGDAWNTFSTFFTHIDNLCHFYWQMLHHEKAEALIDQLSQSSSNAQKILRENAKETERILHIQESMHESITQSLENQKQMTDLINSSSKHILNITTQMESTLERIHKDIEQNYGTIRNVLNSMNEAISQAIYVQSYITAQLGSIRGILFYLCHFLVLLFITSFKRYAQARINCIYLLSFTLFIELLLGNLISNFISIDKIRYFGILVEFSFIWKSDGNKNEFQQSLERQFNTPRIRKIFQKVIEVEQFVIYPKRRLNSHSTCTQVGPTKTDQKSLELLN